MADLPDPSTLSDEELAKMIVGEPLGEPEVETPDDAPEETPEEVEEEEPAAEPEEPEEVEEPEEEPKVSRREQLRINQLLEKMKTAPQAKPDANVSPDSLNYREALEADEQIIKELEADRTRSNTVHFNEGLKQAQNIEWRTLLHIDAPQVEAEHPQLNKRDAENFHPTLANSINRFYFHLSQYDEDTGVAHNPGMRYSDFVESIYELADEIANSKVSSTRKNVAKQAAKTGIRPDGSAAKALNLNKAPEDMTDEELNAYLAKAIPKR